ncbi:MAG: glycosyltransferase family 2 protein [Clostridiales bacterium]|jgi:cellulose synthase/poly-beta-1,6-N-acetylglucosamine synthase-like glycosyltransferase|nr:glycosyltransferase family 2 protein [Clostridiales bacterium]
MEAFLHEYFIIYLIIAAASVLAYGFRISWYFSAFVKQKRLKNDKINRICVVVPARNESKVIRECIAGLLNQSYDKAAYDIHVIVNDARDATIDICKEYGNIAVHVVPIQKCKGDALEGFFGQIDVGLYDAFAIIDADNIADSRFVEEINNAFADGADVVVGKRKVKNWLVKDKRKRSFWANCNALTYTQLDDMGNKWRTKRGLPLTLCGTGYAISARVIIQMGGWHIKGFTEDMLFECECILNNFKMVYYEYACVYTEECLLHTESVKRRSRWLRGFAECGRRYRKKIMANTFTKRGVKVRNLDYLFGLYPILPFLIGTVVSIFMFFGFTVALLILKSPLAWFALTCFLYTFLILYLAVFLFNLCAVIILGKDLNVPPHEKIQIVFLSPFYCFEWGYLALTAFITKPKAVDWSETERIVINDKSEEK